MYCNSMRQHSPRGWVNLFCLLREIIIVLAHRKSVVWTYIYKYMYIECLHTAWSTTIGA